MNPRQILTIVLLIVISPLLLCAQDEGILPAQAEAIRALALANGFTVQTLDEYLVQNWGAPLNRLTKKNAATVINLFQSQTPPSPTQQQMRIPGSDAVMMTESRTSPQPEIQSNRDNAKNLLIAQILEVGMTKRFHLIDGNIIQGTIIKIENDTCRIETTDGVLNIASNDILEETAEITKRDGSRYVGPVLKESIEDITIRSKYGEITVGKRDIFDMNRYHGGRLVPWAEERKTFYRGDVVLTDIFMDPTAFPLETHALYISALSLGYGFTDNLMVRTSFGNNFAGDLNLQPLFQLYSSRTGSDRIAVAIGFDLYSHHDMTTVVSNYARYVKHKATGASLNEMPNVSVSDAISGSSKKTFYSEFYAVFSHRWNLESGRGEMGYHIGFRTNTLPLMRSSILNNQYKWSDDKINIIPFRIWAAFEYDLTKDLKLATNIWADNGYRYRTLNQTIKDYFRDTPFILDSMEGEYRLVDFDFGLLYAVNESLRLGIHFQHPYLQLFWRIVEF